MSPTQYPLHVEILLTPPSSNPCILETPELSLLHTTIAATLQSHASATTTELTIPPILKSLTLPSTPHPLHISRITTTLCEDDSSKKQPSWRVKPITHLYTHSAITVNPPEGAGVTALPCADHESLWENLLFTQPLKSLVLSYSVTRASYKLASSGFILLHGPPGSGKSTLATALAHKLAVRRECQGYLIRLSHGALSKYFGESAHRVGGVFEYALGLTGVVVVVIDEIETFGMTRAGNTSSGDGVRVTNALLTGLDAVRDSKNVMVIGTSNDLHGIDGAVNDRADMVLRVAGMGEYGRTGILKRVLQELVKQGVLKEFGDVSEICRMLNGVSARRVEGCVVVALGLVAKGCGKIEWSAFERALGKAAQVVAAGCNGDCGES